MSLLHHSYKCIVLENITGALKSNFNFRCHFAQHDKTMLIGADPSHVGDRCIRVTIHHCFFDGTQQRHPRVRFGKVHLYNNYTRNWSVYAVCASVESQVVSVIGQITRQFREYLFAYINFV